MSGLFSIIEDPADTEYGGPFAVFAGGISYETAGAKFWVSVCDELAEDFPACARLCLEWVSAGLPCAAALYPAARLEHELGALEDADFSAVMREVLEEINLLGPPGAVRAILQDAGRATLKEVVLPDDAVDAEGMAYLVSWLFELAGINQAEWEMPERTGVANLADRKRGWSYRLAFMQRHSALPEGLFQHVLHVYPSRAKAGSR